MGESVLRVALTDRYLDAFRTLEGALRESANAVEALTGPDGRERDIHSLINLAQERGWVRPDAARFLHSCRRARNAFTHVDFQGYQGPAALPPEEVVFRLERITTSLKNPPRAKTVTRAATTCRTDTPIGDVLRIMLANDFSQVPYKAHDGAWELITHHTVSRWVSAEAGAGADCILDLGMPVVGVVELSGIRCRPAFRSSDALVTELISDLEAAVELPDDSAGGYSAVLVEASDPDSVRIFVPDDLPRAYDLIGR